MPHVKRCFVTFFLIDYTPLPKLLKRFYQPATAKLSR